MPFIDSLVTSLLKDDDFYQLSAYWSGGNGENWWIQILTAFIGAAVGGAFAGIVTWRMGKKYAEDQLERDKNRDEFQQKLEINRDQRQKIWILLQDLLEFASRILEADRYASCCLQNQMQVFGNQDAVNYFGSLVDKIEFLWHQKSFLLDDEIATSIKKIVDLMNEYKLSAMQCTMNAIPAGQPYNTSHNQKNQIVNQCIAKCSSFRSSWNGIWNDLNSQMRKMKEEVL